MLPRPPDGSGSSGGMREELRKRIGRTLLKVLRLYLFPLFRNRPTTRRVIQALKWRSAQLERCPFLIVIIIMSTVTASNTKTNNTCTKNISGMLPSVRTMAHLQSLI